MKILPLPAFAVSVRSTGMPQSEIPTKGENP